MPGHLSLNGCLRSDTLVGIKEGYSTSRRCTVFPVLNGGCSLFCSTSGSASASNKNQDPDPDPHQYEKLDPDPYNFTDDKQIYMEYEPI